MLEILFLVLSAICIDPCGIIHVWSCFCMVRIVSVFIIIFCSLKSFSYDFVCIDRLWLVLAFPGVVGFGSFHFAFFRVDLNFISNSFPTHLYFHLHFDFHLHLHSHLHLDSSLHSHTQSGISVSIICHFAFSS
ncbi:hypothetical protein V1520DRAFT_344381 [Lipomyces starkeyi]